MWIKKTTVKGKNKTYEYLQLIHSVSINGHARHQVVANLGRADQVNYLCAEALAKSLSLPGDTLPIEQLSLLPDARCGQTIFIEKIFEQFRFQGSFSEYLVSKHMNEQLANVCLSVLSYYLCGYNSVSLFYSWIKKNYLSYDTDLSETNLIHAFSFLSTPHIFHNSLLGMTHHHPTEITYHFVYRCVNRSKTILTPANDLTVMISTDDFFDFKDFHLDDQVHCPASNSIPENDILISDNWQLLHTNVEDFVQHPFICKIDRSQLQELLDFNPSSLHLLMRDYICDHDIGYCRAAKPPSGTLIAMRSFYTDDRNPDDECLPSEFLITTCDLPLSQIVAAYRHLWELQINFFDVSLPKDLYFLSRRLSGDSLYYACLNCCFVRLYLRDYIDRRLAPAGMTTDDALYEFNNLLAVTLNYHGHTKHLHSYLSDPQKKILDLLGFFPHPTLGNASSTEKKIHPDF